MGLQEILDITETVQTNDQGQLQQAFEVTFLTDRTSGAKSLIVSADEFSVDRAEALARDRAEQLDALVRTD